MFEIGLEGKTEKKKSATHNNLHIHSFLLLIEDGSSMHLTKHDYMKCVETIRTVSNTLEADFANIDDLNHLDSTLTPKSQETDIVAHFMIRKRPKTVEDLLEIRVAVVGNVDAGKVKKKKVSSYMLHL